MDRHGGLWSPGLGRVRRRQCKGGEGWSFISAAIVGEALQNQRHIIRFPFNSDAAKILFQARFGGGTARVQAQGWKLYGGRIVKCQHLVRYRCLLVFGLR